MPADALAAYDSESAVGKSQLLTSHIPHIIIINIGNLTLFSSPHLYLLVSYWWGPKKKGKKNGPPGGTLFSLRWGDGGVQLLEVIISWVTIAVHDCLIDSEICIFVYLIFVFIGWRDGVALSQCQTISSINFWPKTT